MADETLTGESNVNGTETPLNESREVNQTTEITLASESMIEQHKRYRRELRR